MTTLHRTARFALERDLPRIAVACLVLAVVGGAVELVAAFV